MLPQRLNERRRAASPKTTKEENVNLNKNNRIVLWISLFMTLAPAGSVILAQTQDSNPVTEIVSLLQKHDQALNQHDLNAALFLYAAGDTTVLSVFKQDPYERVAIFNPSFEI